MYVSLLILGVLFTAAGFATIGFGIPINAFSLGNTLIIAGTTAVTGGLLLIGLAVTVRQLQRIAEALNAGASAHRTHPSEGAEASRVPPTARLTPAAARAPAPPVAGEMTAARPPEAAMPHPAEPRLTLEPRFPATAPSEASGPLDWLRSKPKANGEAPVVEVLDEAPLSPRTPPRPPMSPLSNLAEPMAEPKVWSPNRSGAPADNKPASRAEQIARATPPGEQPKDNGVFDAVWSDARPARPTNGAPDQRKAAPEGPPARPREEPVAAGPAEVPPAPGPESPVAILKSGVIDGMAYTLYVDGSIEAELPQGTVRFASVDALRAHLEKNG